MPLVLVAAKRDRPSNDALAYITQKLLPEVVTEALSLPNVEGAKLTPNEISVRGSRAGEFDVLTHDLEIIVFANFFPERQAILKQAVTQILQRLRERLCMLDLTCFVWILLVPAEFREFPDPADLKEFQAFCDSVPKQVSL